MIVLSQASVEAQHALARIRGALFPVALLTLVLAFVPLAVALYVLLQFGVASPGRSVQTVLGLLLVILVVIGVSAVLSVLRGQVLAQIGTIAVNSLSPRLHQATGSLAEASRTGGQEAGQVTADLDAIMQFTRSGALAGWLDIAGLPILLLVMLALHGWLALALLLIAGAALLVLGSTLVALQRPRRLAQRIVARRRAFMEENRARQDVLRGLGAVSHAERAWHGLNVQVLALDAAWRVIHTRNVAIIRHLQLGGVCLVIALGTWLEIAGKAVPSVIVAAAFVAWLALRPFVTAVESAWLLVDVLEGWARIDRVLQAIPADPTPLPLPSPTRTISGEQVVVAVPGNRRVLLHNINFRLDAGQVLTVLGAAGAGKSVLLRALAGAWPVAGGKIRLDGAALDQWSNDQVGRHIGYLPQSVELFDGTVAENIARFRPDVTGEMVVAAAQKAMAHDMILTLPDGYDTLIGANGRLLSGSQAQTIGLARALLGDPFVLVLDEPTAHGDRNSIINFRKVVENARDEGKIVILGGGASVLVELATHVLMVDHGTAAYFGETEAVRRAIMERKAQRQSMNDRLSTAPESEAPPLGGDQPEAMP